MTRIFTAGFESGNAVGFSAGGGTAVVSTVQKRTGAYSMAIPNDGAAEITWSVRKTELYLRIAYYFTSLAGNAMLIGFLDNTPGWQCRLYCPAGSKLLTAVRGAATVLATGTHVVPLDQWVCIEIHVKVADAGTFTVKMDGVTEFDFSGDTKATTIAGTDYCRLGAYDASNDFVGYIDDIAINDTAGAVNNSWIGRGGVYVGLPEEAGTYTDLHASTGNAWDCINEVPPDDADYVSDDTVDQKSTYGMSAITPATGTIACINVIMRAIQSAAGTASIARLIRSNAVDSQGSDVGLSVTAQMIQENIETDPGEVPGTAWTIAAVNALEAGCTIR
jgi:hypothetical protein